MNEYLSKREAVFALLALVLLLLLIFPGYELGNRVEPFVLGLPFSLFWVVAGVGLAAVLVIVFYVTEPHLGREE